MKQAKYLKFKVKSGGHFSNFLQNTNNCGGAFMAHMCFCIWYFEGIQWQPCAQEKIVWATASKLLFPLHLTSANLPVIAITRHTPLPHTISMMYHSTYHTICIQDQRTNHHRNHQTPLCHSIQWSNILPTKALNTAKKINKLTTASNCLGKCILM